MFKEHQDGENVYCFCENVMTGEIPMMSVSASVKDGVMTVTAANCSLEESAELDCDISGFECSSVSARILTDEVHSFNSFDAPEKVAPEALSASVSDGKLSAVLPACSVAVFTIS